MEDTEERSELGPWVDLSKPGAASPFPASRSVDQDEGGSPLSPFSSRAVARSALSSDRGRFSPGAFSDDAEVRVENLEKARLSKEDLWGDAEGQTLRQSGRVSAGKSAADLRREGEKDGLSAERSSAGNPCQRSQGSPRAPNAPRMQNEGRLASSPPASGSMGKASVRSTAQAPRSCSSPSLAFDAPPSQRGEASCALAPRSSSLSNPCAPSPSLSSSFSSSDLFASSGLFSDAAPLAKAATLPPAASAPSLSRLASSADSKLFAFDFTYTRSGFHRRVLAPPHPSAATPLTHAAPAPRSSPAAPRSSPAAPRSSPAAPRSSLAAPRSSPAAPRSSPAAPGYLSLSSYPQSSRGAPPADPATLARCSTHSFPQPPGHAPTPHRQLAYAAFFDNAAPTKALTSTKALASDGEDERSGAGEESSKQRTLRRVASAAADGADEEVAEPAHFGDLQVLVDIDDTVRSSGGVTFLSVSLGGIDTQYERGAFYPGCFQFLFELAVHGLRGNQRPLSLGVLTARIPQVPITADSVLNQKLRETALRRGIRGWGIDCKNKVLYSTLNEWIFPSEKGKRKFENLLLLHSKLSATHPNIKYVWIGDTGEMDRHAGEMMARQMPNTLKAIFLHYVGDYGRNSKLPQDYFVNGVPTVFFRTYIRAARRAVDLGLLEKKALARTMVQAVADLDAMQNTPSVSTKWRDIIFDIRDAEELVPLKGATLPPLVRTREILHRRITEIKGALQRFRAKRGVSTGQAQASTGDGKPSPEPSSPQTAHATPKKGGSSSSLALYEARQRGEARVPESLANRAAVHQRERERRGNRRSFGEKEKVGENFDVLAPAATLSAAESSDAGAGRAAEDLRRHQEGSSSSSSLPPGSGEPLEEEASWVEVRFDPETGRFPVLQPSERQREGSWRSRKDTGPEQSQPFYKTLLHASESSGDVSCEARSGDQEGAEGSAEARGKDLEERRERHRREREEAENPWWDDACGGAGREARISQRQEGREDKRSGQKAHADDIELLDLAPKSEEPGRTATAEKQLGEGNPHDGESRGEIKGRDSDSGNPSLTPRRLLSGGSTPVEPRPAAAVATPSRPRSVSSSRRPSPPGGEGRAASLRDQRDSRREAETAGARQRTGEGREIAETSFIEEWKELPKREISSERRLARTDQPPDLLS
ncbi:conserved hypothetical protein [Neospora caninum Liverpool]|uniref:Phosphatidate phosphatase APP1 catalytic domain-containing protein n=1 Tax=Neospora caninum (strain Liverpool) TaxID=572307 RepID=F0VR60_NEOCL|nr:conserved hypothetical protein [Neospora caninum Liverpool]CBZ56208.1 conserved hypothetical protein [Neospora caninum Liverpool]CEL70970.1 TPA: hypothetical protein BN1204_066330 [Neospora caninum Liverpool]|eukprot:XP_003886233.1 conserved hypothetical protein [Neospora caninum Liverpool]